MRIARKLNLLAITGALFVALLAPAAHAQTPQGDNVAAEVNTKDNSTVFDLSFNIRRVMAGAVDTDNAAVAVGSCQDCRTVAVAIQVVLIFSDPDVVTTDNLALALNIACTSCETMALAYQYVLTTDGPVHFTAEGNRTINDILKQIADIGSNEELPLEEIAAQIDLLVEELYAVVDNELVSAGRPATDAEEQEAAETGTSPTPAEATTEDTSSPAPAPTEPEPSADAEPSPSEEASPATTP